MAFDGRASSINAVEIFVESVELIVQSRSIGHRLE